MVKDIANIVTTRFNEIANIDVDYADNMHIFVDVVHYNDAKKEVFFTVCDLYFDNCSVDVFINNGSLAITFMYDKLYDIDEFVGLILCKRFYGE